MRLSCLVIRLMVLHLKCFRKPCRHHLLLKIELINIWRIHRAKLAAVIAAWNSLYTRFIGTHPQLQSKRRLVISWRWWHNICLVEPHIWIRNSIIGLLKLLQLHESTLNGPYWGLVKTNKLIVLLKVLETSYVHCHLLFSYISCRSIKFLYWILTEWKGLHSWYNSLLAFNIKFVGRGSNSVLNTVHQVPFVYYEFLPQLLRLAKSVAVESIWSIQSPLLRFSKSLRRAINAISWRDKLIVFYALVIDPRKNDMSFFDLRVHIALIGSYSLISLDEFFIPFNFFSLVFVFGIQNFHNNLFWLVVSQSFILILQRLWSLLGKEY